MEPNGKDVATNKLLKSLIFGDELDLGSADDLDAAANPFEKLQHRGALRAALGKTSDAHCAIDLPLPDQSGIDDELSSPFWKAPQIIRYAAAPTLAKADAPPPRTLAQKLGIVRSETVKTADGDTWLHGFNEKNELVDARILEAVAE